MSKKEKEYEADIKRLVAHIEDLREELGKAIEERKALRAEWAEEREESAAAVRRLAEMYEARVPVPEMTGEEFEAVQAVYLWA